MAGTPAEKLRAYLEWAARHDEFRYVLEHGTAFEPAELTAEEAAYLRRATKGAGRSEPRQCYMNSQRLVLRAEPLLQEIVRGARSCLG